MPRDRFRQIANGLFNSRLLFCLQVFGNILGLATNDESTRRFSAFTKNDNRKLQVLQNQVLRMMTGLSPDTPTTRLLHDANSLSVHQLTAFTTLLSAQKAMFNDSPEYLARKLDITENNIPLRNTNILRVRAELTLTRGGFFYRAALLWNQLPDGLRSRLPPDLFKEKVKNWVKANILAKPP